MPTTGSAKGGLKPALYFLLPTQNKQSLDPITASVRIHSARQADLQRWSGSPAVTWGVIETVREREDGELWCTATGRRDWSRDNRWGGQEAARHQIMSPSSPKCDPKPYESHFHWWLWSFYSSGNSIMIQIRKWISIFHAFAAKNLDLCFLFNRTSWGQRANHHWWHNCK